MDELRRDLSYRFDALQIGITVRVVGILLIMALVLAYVVSADRKLAARLTAIERLEGEAHTAAAALRSKVDQSRADLDDAIKRGDLEAAVNRLHGVEIAKLKRAIEDRGNATPRFAKGSPWGR